MTYFSLHQPGSYLPVAKYQRHRLHIRLLFRSAVIQSPSQTRKLPLSLWMELDTSYKKQGGESQRTTGAKQQSWAAPSAHGLLAETSVCLFQFCSALQNVKLFYLTFICSTYLSWIEADENSSSKKALLSADRQVILHAVSAVLAVSNSTLNIICWLSEQSSTASV